jgi:hypothetical protein
MTVEKLMTMDKEQLPEAAMDLDSSELPGLWNCCRKKTTLYGTRRFSPFSTDPG